MKYNALEFMGLHLILQVNDDYLANDEIIWFLVRGQGQQLVFVLHWNCWADKQDISATALVSLTWKLKQLSPKGYEDAE